MGQSSRLPSSDASGGYVGRIIGWDARGPEYPSAVAIKHYYVSERMKIIRKHLLPQSRKRPRQQPQGHLRRVGSRGRSILPGSSPITRFGNKRKLSIVPIAMNTFISKKGTMTRVIVALSTVAVLAVTGVVVPQAASAVTAEELAAQILLLQAQLNELLGQQGGGATACTFTRDLFMGVSSGADVKCLQQYLNSVGNTVSTSGAGSPGNETTFFGSRTKAAVAEWQQENGVTPTAGYFGARSRAKYNQIGGTPPPPPPPPLPPPGTPPSATGTGLTVAAAMQPGDSLAPPSAARRPATPLPL